MRLLAVALLVAVLGAGFVAVRDATSNGQAPADGSGHGPLYLALGDSLAKSMQPNARGNDHPTSDGYSEAIWQTRAKSIHGLKLVKLGRGGETAAGMVKSPRSGPSQLQQAEALLRTGRVVFVTIDIGANEVETCQSGDGFNSPCVQRGLASLRASLPKIINGLRAAGGSKVPIVGMNYYNSFLGRWVTGPSGRRVALASVPVENEINDTLAAIYHRAGVPMANVAARFATNSFRPVNTPKYGRVPLAVANTCRWTWACSARYDDHTNTAGYELIARTVLALLPS